MFITTNKVRMHDTEIAGILYFARQFRFVHDALEDLVESEGLSFHKLFHESPFVFVVVHVEADYLTNLKVGDKLEIHVKVAEIGNSSFTIEYLIYREDNVLVGRAKTVHVSLESKSRKKIPLPKDLKNILIKYQN